MYISKQDKLILESYKQVINEALDPAMELDEYSKKIEQSISNLSGIKQTLKSILAFVNIGTVISRGINAFGGDSAPDASHADAGSGQESPDTDTTDVNGDTVDGKGDDIDNFNTQSGINISMDDIEKTIKSGGTLTSSEQESYAIHKLMNDYGLKKEDLVKIVKNNGNKTISSALNLHSSGSIPTDVEINGKTYDLTQHLSKNEALRLNSIKGSSIFGNGENFKPYSYEGGPEYAVFKIPEFDSLNVNDLTKLKNNWDKLGLKYSYDDFAKNASSEDWVKMFKYAVSKGGDSKEAIKEILNNRLYTQKALDAAKSLGFSKDELDSFIDQSDY